MNMFKVTSAKTPEEYINLIEDQPRKSEIIFLHNLIKKTVPKLKPYILVGMIGYGTYHYKSKSGREGDWSIIALASQKNYISVYVCAVDGNEYIAEKYKEQFGKKISIGKSCIRFKKLDDINLDLLKEVIIKAENLPNPQ